MKRKVKRAKKPKRIEKYWICDGCVKEKHPDWKHPDYPVTVLQGLCGHCNREDITVLTPIVDFKQKRYFMWD